MWRSDDDQRRHHFQVRLPPAYPEQAPSVLVDMPTPLELRWRGGAQAGLSDVLQQVRERLHVFRDAWRVLDDVDRRCLVLEPSRGAGDAGAHVPRQAMARRIALGQHRTLAFVVDWRAPRKLPQRCQLMGPERAVAPLRLLLARASVGWDVAQSLVDNLQRVLQLQFPTPGEHVAAEFADECGICYAYRLVAAASAAAAQTPDVVCDNAQCGKPFHRACLVQWLAAVPDNRQSFGLIFGACPFCQQPIKAQMG